MELTAPNDSGITLEWRETRAVDFIPSPDRHDDLWLSYPAAHRLVY